MEMSYKSFEKIIADSDFIFKKLQSDYWAHILEEKKTVEKLDEHSQLVSQYLIRIIKEHDLEPIIERIIEKLSNSIFKNHSSAIINLIKELFINSIYFHDIGKVNPDFQVNRMKNHSFKPENFKKIKHYHSFPGAYIYCVYYFKLIFQSKNIVESKEERNLLAFLVFSLSNPIIRHHSSFIDFYESFNDEEVLQECSKLLKHYSIEVKEDLNSAIFSHIEPIKEYFIKNSNEESKLYIYILIKLSFSLLTACDYYATNEYLTGIKISNFGLIHDELRRKIIESFWATKEHNKELKAKFQFFRNKKFDDIDIQKTNKKGLNILRQKITAEVIIALDENPNNHWYYIEAPTGAGKTNLSLASVVRLLEKHSSINKVFYVFPFTTLITQTFESIRSTLNLTNDEIIQLHSKTGLHLKTQYDEEDAKYGNERTFYLDHLFVNYPFIVTSHVKFFEIIKGNDKETNYVFHRLCNSIVIIDELQYYNPKHWDKIIFFIEHYAKLLNIKFIIMSATLPKIDEMSNKIKGKFISLTPNKDQYFKNPNFRDRVQYDFSLIDDLRHLKNNKDKYLTALADKIKSEAEQYACNNKGKVRVLIEFITKNTASRFFLNILNDNRFTNYKIYLISGDIIEPRQKEVINKVKSGEDSKVVLISTQVVEAGVDIDMDIGFKNRAILDSDEQLAGRVNRNASKTGCKVFLFELDDIATIYGRDERFKQQKTNKYFDDNWKKILIEKRFHELYNSVFKERLKSDWTDADRFPAYMENFKRFDFNAINSDFKLIEDNETQRIFIPIKINIPEGFENPEILKQFDVLTQDNKISGELVFQRLVEVLTRKSQNSDVLKNKVNLKKIAGLISLFIISVNPKVIALLKDHFDPEKEKYGFKYLLNHDVYSYENGFDMTKLNEDIFL